MAEFELITESTDNRLALFQAILAGLDPGQLDVARAGLGLVLQSSPTDTTAGNVTIHGAFGLGASLTYNSTHDLDTIAPGFWGGSSTANTPANTPVSFSRWGGFTAAASASTAWQLAGRTTSHGAYHRSKDASVWGDWVKIYDRKSVLGTVSETSGVPTGAAIERGSNANGEYVRFADGTQICTNGNAAITTAPAAFVGPITKIDGDKLWVGVWFT